MRDRDRNKPKSFFKSHQWLLSSAGIYPMCVVLKTGFSMERWDHMFCLGR